MRKALLTIVLVGDGPSGVETARARPLPTFDKGNRLIIRPYVRKDTPPPIKKEFASMEANSYQS